MDTLLHFGKEAFNFSANALTSVCFVIGISSVVIILGLSDNIWVQFFLLMEKAECGEYDVWVPFVSFSVLKMGEIM